MDFIITPTAKPGDFNAEELTWGDIRNVIQQTNPELFRIIEMLSPDNSLTLIKARYPYGATIINKGTLCLPHQSGVTISIHNATVSPHLKTKLGYSAIPLGLPLNKACEVFVSHGQRVIPLKVITPYWFFGLFEVTALLSGVPNAPIWSVSSGMRSIFMLPKIADKQGYTRLKKALDLSLMPPRTLADHWQLFTQIIHYPSYVNTWYSDILFFTDTWFKKKLSDPKWAVFYNYLFKESNVQSHYNLDDMAFNLGWKNFIYTIGRRNLRPRPYIIDTLKYLVAIATGRQPGFCPVDDSELSAPTKLLQEVYVDLYGLKYYLPTLMQPHMLMMGQPLRPLYYSLAFPMIEEGRPDFKGYSDVISDEREIKRLFDTLSVAVQHDHECFPEMYNFIRQGRYEFFHNNMDIYHEVLSSKEMPMGDASLLQDKVRFPSRDFCASAPFLSGCIRISTEKIHTSSTTDYSASLAGMKAL